MKKRFLCGIIRKHATNKIINKGECIYILRRVQYFTKEIGKALRIVIIALAIICSIIYIKYQPAYVVTVAGEKVGYVVDKEYLDNKIDKFLNSKEGNVAVVEIDAMPEYEYKLLNRNIVTDERKIFAQIQSNAKITYKVYAITIDNEEKATVATEKEAEVVINEMKNSNPNIELNLAVVEKYTDTITTGTMEDVKVACADSINAKVNAYNQKKAAEAAAAKKAAAQKAANTRVSGAKVNNSALNGLTLVTPVSGTITSRFGNRSRGYHTGLDIAAPLGTNMGAIASGTVTYAGYKGSYGNLVIISHGNGVQSYYAHCNKLLVSVGQSVAAGQVIAQVGSTGNSTGPHLHLEIRINGTAVNPQNYLY